MFKFSVERKNGCLIGLGFFEGNFERLKAGKPIMIYYGELKKSWPGGIIVSYPSPEVDAARGRIPPNWTLVEIGDEQMAYMRANNVLGLKLAEGRDAWLFWGKDEEAIRDRMGHLIGPNTEDMSPTVRDGQHYSKMRPS